MFSGRTDYINGDRATVKSPEDLMRIFYTGAFHRTTGETKMNRNVAFRPVVTPC